MRIIIVGAGQLGQMLAEQLCSEKNDVVMIDRSPSVEELTARLDMMAIVGTCTNLKVLRQAQPDEADLLLAVTGDEADNILACQFGKKLGVKRTICRLFSLDTFPEQDGPHPQDFGIDVAFSSLAESARCVSAILANRIVIGQIEFSNKEAIVSVLKVDENSMLHEMCLEQFPEAELLSKVRIAALIRRGRLIWPSGNTRFQVGDKLYLAGRRADVADFLRFVDQGEKAEPKVIVLGGASPVNIMIAQEALTNQKDVRIVEPDEKRATEVLEEMQGRIRVIVGQDTEASALKEAGIRDCDVYVGADIDDENSILSCILAKSLGAPKVAAVTTKSEYVSIVPAMEVIESGFNSTVVAANIVLKLIGQDESRLEQHLQLVQGAFREFYVGKRSPLVGKYLREVRLPQKVVLALLIRDNEVSVPNGRTLFQCGDMLVAVVTPETEQQLKRIFPG